MYVLKPFHGLAGRESGREPERHVLADETQINSTVRQSREGGRRGEARKSVSTGTRATRACGSALDGLDADAATVFWSALRLCFLSEEDWLIRLVTFGG